MIYSQRFVQHFDRLVRLLADAPMEIAEQKEALRELRGHVADGEVTIIATEGGVSVNGRAADAELVEPGTIGARMLAHGVQRLFVARDAAAADLLTTARALASLPGDPEMMPLSLLELRTVRVSSSLEPPRPSLPELSPGALSPFFDDASFGLLPASGGYEPVPENLPAGSALGEEGMANDAAAAAAAAASGVGRPTPVLGAQIVGATALIHTASSVADQEAYHTDLLDRLAAAERLPEVNRLLEELAARVERATRDGEGDIVRDVMFDVLRREEDCDVHEFRLAFHMCLRRIVTPSHLRTVAQLIPRQPKERDTLLYILGRCGEEGADQVIDLLVAAQSPSDRRAYFETLIRLQAGEAAVLHMLGDQRWYVVRNAAELLGEMGVASAEDALVGVLKHRDDRVQKAALSALCKLNTVRGYHALREALVAPDAGMRAHAASTMAGSSYPYAAATLRRALREEQDPEVQQVMVAALGRLGTEDAVSLLNDVAAPPRSLLFRSRATPLRLAAVRALADAGTAGAQETLTKLARDRDAEVRGVATRALEQLRETPAASARAVPEERRTPVTRTPVAPRPALHNHALRPTPLFNPNVPPPPPEKPRAPEPQEPLPLLDDLLPSADDLLGGDR